MHVACGSGKEEVQAPISGSEKVRNVLDGFRIVKMHIRKKNENHDFFVLCAYKKKGGWLQRQEASCF